MCVCVRELCFDHIIIIICMINNKNSHSLRFDQVMNAMFIEFFLHAQIGIYLIGAHDDSNDRHELANKFAHSHLSRFAVPQTTRKYQTCVLYAFTFANNK